MLLDGSNGFGVVNSVYKDLNLDDGDKASLFPDISITDQAIHGLVIVIVGGGVVCHIDTDSCTLLGKPGLTGVVANVLVVEVMPQILHSLPLTRDSRLELTLMTGLPPTVCSRSR